MTRGDEFGDGNNNEINNGIDPSVEMRELGRREISALAPIPAKSLF